MLTFTDESWCTVNGLFSIRDVCEFNWVLHSRAIGPAIHNIISCVPY